MELKTALWYGVLGSITVGYVIALVGVNAARHHEVRAHSRSMTAACAIVGLWLIAYVTKQVLYGREHFGGTDHEYWTRYFPLACLHMLLAVTTIGLGSYNLYLGRRKIHGGGVGAMSSRLLTHRRLGWLTVWSFSATMATAYLVYLMLFAWYPA